MFVDCKVTAQRTWENWFGFRFCGEITNETGAKYVKFGPEIERTHTYTCNKYVFRTSTHMETVWNLTWTI
jgi:hypothetical protein